MAIATTAPEGREQGHLRTPQQPAPDVAAGAVGAEEMLSARRRQVVGDVGEVCTVGRQHRGEEGRQDYEEKDEDGCRAERVAEDADDDRPRPRRTPQRGRW